MEAAASTYAGIMFPEAVSPAATSLSDMQKAMLDATPDCIKLVSTGGDLLMMNRSGCLALGVDQDGGFGMPWLPLLPEGVHPAGREALARAAAGEAARFPGMSVSPAGTLYWDNLLTPLVDGSGQVLSILCVSRDVTEKTLLDRQLQEAIDRETLLANEMRHRIKNLFSLVASLISISQREAGARESAGPAIEILRDKLGALSRATDAVFALENGGMADQSPVDVGAVVGSVLQPYGARCEYRGEAASIPMQAVTTLALFLHELATNATKHGALGQRGGRVSLGWDLLDDHVRLRWVETGGPAVSAPPSRQGFGTAMVDRIVRSTGGTIMRNWRPEGLTVELALPAYVEA